MLCNIISNEIILNLTLIIIPADKIVHNFYLIKNFKGLTECLYSDKGKNESVEYSDI